MARANMPQGSTHALKKIRETGKIQLKIRNVKPAMPPANISVTSPPRIPIIRVKLLTFILLLPDHCRQIVSYFWRELMKFGLKLGKLMREGFGIEDLDFLPC